MTDPHAPQPQYPPPGYPSPQPPQPPQYGPPQQYAPPPIAGFPAQPQYPPQSQYPAQSQYPPPPGYPAAPYPAWGAPPPQPPKQRAGLIIGLVAAGLAVIAVAGLAVGIYYVTKDDGGAGPGSNQGAAAATTAAVKGFHLVAPDSAGSWRKAAGAEQNAILRQAVAKEGVSSPFMATYQDGSGHKVTLGGGTSAAIGHGRESVEASTGIVALARAFGAASGAPHAGLDPGMIGGVGECSKIDKSGATTVCVWYADGVMLDFVFDGLAPDEAGAAIRTLLPAVVTLS